MLRSRLCVCGSCWDKGTQQGRRGAHSSSCDDPGRANARAKRSFLGSRHDEEVSPPDTAAASTVYMYPRLSFHPRLFSPSSALDATYQLIRSLPPARARLTFVASKPGSRQNPLRLSLVAHLLGARAGSGVCFAVWLSALRGRHASQRSARTSAGAACLVVSPRSLRRCRTALQTCASGNALCRGKQVLRPSLSSAARVALPLLCTPFLTAAQARTGRAAFTLSSSKYQLTIRTSRPSLACQRGCAFGVRLSIACADRPPSSSTSTPGRTAASASAC